MGGSIGGQPHRSDIDGTIAQCFGPSLEGDRESGANKFEDRTLPVERVQSVVAGDAGGDSTIVNPRGETHGEAPFVLVRGLRPPVESLDRDGVDRRTDGARHRNGGAVKKKSKIPSEAQSAASASRSHISPMKSPMCGITTWCSG